MIWMVSLAFIFFLRLFHQNCHRQLSLRLWSVGYCRNCSSLWRSFDIRCHVTFCLISCRVCWSLPWCGYCFFYTQSLIGAVFKLQCSNNTEIVKTFLPFCWLLSHCSAKFASSIDDVFSQNLRRMVKSMKSKLLDIYGNQSLIKCACWSSALVMFTLGL